MVYFTFSWNPFWINFGCSFIKGDLFIGFSLILFELRGRKLRSYLCFHGLEKGKAKIIFQRKYSDGLNQYFFFFFFSPLKRQTNRIFMPLYFWKKEGTLNNGIKPFWWKYSDGLNQNLNPKLELNPSKRLRTLGKDKKKLWLKKMLSFDYCRQICLHHWSYLNLSNKLIYWKNIFPEPMNHVCQPMTATRIQAFKKGHRHEKLGRDSGHRCAASHIRPKQGN